MKAKINQHKKTNPAYLTFSGLLLVGFGIAASILNPGLGLAVVGTGALLTVLGLIVNLRNKK